MANDESAVNKEVDEDAQQAVDTAYIKNYIDT